MSIERNWVMLLWVAALAGCVAVGGVVGCATPAPSHDPMDRDVEESEEPEDEEADEETSGEPAGENAGSVELELEGRAASLARNN